MRAGLVAALLLTAVLVSGCAGSDDPTDPDDGTSPSPGEGDGQDPYAQAAVWQLGQWFEYRSQSPDGESAEVTLVVTNVASANYTLDTTGRDMAAFHAEEPISFVGPIQKADLSGDQAGTQVRFFRFPLEVGDEWTTEWDGERRTVTVTEDREDFRSLRATADGVPRVDYSYRPEAGFFGFSHFLNPDGEAMFTLTLADWGENFTGAYVRASFTELFSAIGGGGPSQESFSVPEGTQELVLRYNVACANATAGNWAVAFLPLESEAPQEDGHEANGECPEGVEAEVVLTNPVPGDWQYSGNYAGVDPAGAGGTDHEISAAARNFRELSFP